MLIGLTLNLAKVGRGAGGAATLTASTTTTPMRVNNLGRDLSNAQYSAQRSLGRDL